MLTRRQLEILALTASGATCAIICKELNISKHTVNAHKAQIIERLESENITHAIAISIRRGWLRHGDNGLEVVPATGP